MATSIPTVAASVTVASLSQSEKELRKFLAVTADTIYHPVMMNVRTVRITIVGMYLPIDLPIFPSSLRYFKYKPHRIISDITNVSTQHAKQMIAKGTVCRNDISNVLTVQFLVNSRRNQHNGPKLP